MVVRRGDRVTLRADPDGRWERETAVVEEISETPGGTSYVVRLDSATGYDDGFREVTEDQFE